MGKNIRAAIIGMDTVHAVKFAGFIHDPATKPEEKIEGIEITKCLRFKTPFQSTEGLDKRQHYLESLGIPVTEKFDDAVEGCDAIFMTIDDASLHKQYFELCAKTGKPVYIDKPFADTLENARAMVETARKYGTRFFTASSLRFDVGVTAAARKHKTPDGAIVYGALGTAPAGSSVIWYAVHCFEILQRIMGRGALSLTALTDERGAVCHVVYPGGRRGTIEFLRDTWQYGGIIHGSDGTHEFFRNSSELSFYVPLLRECVSFFRGETEGVPLEDSMEIMGMIAAADRSFVTGKTERIQCI